MSVTKSDIEGIAKLARLGLDQEHIPEITGRLNDILAMVEQLQAVDTEGVEPMDNPLDATQRLRVDEVTATDQHEYFQTIAPAAEKGLYLVPKVIE